MSDAMRRDDFGSSRDIVLIVRLVLDREARLSHGELLDAHGLQRDRFLTVAGLADAGDRWLGRQH